MEKIKILFYHLKNTGCGFYRQLLPYGALKVFDKIDIRFIDFKSNMTQGGHIDLTTMGVDQEMADAVDWCDIIVFGREWLPQGLTLLNMARKKGKKSIYDLDDNLLIIPDWNPAGRLYNHQQVKELVIKFLRNVDLITCTHNQLASYFGQFKTTKVLKNFVYEPFFRTSKVIVKKEENDICIGWAGSGTHYKDLMEIKGVIEQILSEFKNTFFLFLGSCPQEIMKLDEKRIAVLKANFDTLEYFKLLKGLNLDIAIAPLIDVRFNEGKSNLKVLEYSACKYPVIASKVFEYRKYVTPNKDALLVTKYIDWYKSLKKLIKDRTFREYISQNAYQRVKQYCNIKQNCQNWLDTYCDFLGRSREKIINNFGEDEFTEKLRNQIHQWAWFGPVSEEKKQKSFIQQKIQMGDFDAIKQTFDKSGFSFTKR